MAATCLLHTASSGPCPLVEDNDFPICPKHLERLEHELRCATPRHVRENYTEKQGEGFIFNRKDGGVYSLNPTAAFILQGIMRGDAPPKVLRDLALTFDLDSLEEALAGYRDLVSELRRLGLLE
jgi:hypothetical protein